MLSKSASTYLLKFNSANTRKKCDIFSKLTIKIHKEVVIINFEQREINAKGDDNFATKTASMKNIERKNSGLYKKCEK